MVWCFGSFSLVGMMGGWNGRWVWLVFGWFLADEPVNRSFDQVLGCSLGSLEW